MPGNRVGRPRGVPKGTCAGGGGGMKAEYTCVDGGGNKYVVTCETSKSIEDIKALASEAHKASILDVVGEKSIGKPPGDEEEDE